MRPKIVNMELEPPERECAFLVDVANAVCCGAPGTHHVFWAEEMYDGDVTWTCEEHLAFCVAHDPWRVHVVGPDCGMPGSLFYPDTNICRCDDPEVWDMQELELELVG